MTLFKRKSWNYNDLTSIKLLCNDVSEWDVVYTYDTNDVTRSVLELINLEHLVVQSAE